MGNRFFALVSVPLLKFSMRTNILSCNVLQFQYNAWLALLKSYLAVNRLVMFPYWNFVKLISIFNINLILNIWNQLIYLIFSLSISFAGDNPAAMYHESTGGSVRTHESQYHVKMLVIICALTLLRGCIEFISNTWTHRNTQNS